MHTHDSVSAQPRETSAAAGLRGPDPTSLPDDGLGPAADVQVVVHQGAAAIDAARSHMARQPATTAPAHDLRWLPVLREGLGHTPFLLAGRIGSVDAGWLPLALVRSVLFGRYLVGLPYVNSGGVQAARSEVAVALVDRAVELADSLNVKHLELRHETELAHPRLGETMDAKVHMRLKLCDSSDEQWSALSAKVRNQIRKGEKQEFEVCWGREDLLGEFHKVFSRNMRDLGTPVYGKRLFRAILEHFGKDAELCVLRLKGLEVAAALLVHGAGVTEVPSASALREYNATNANMFMYWQLLQKAIERRNQVFDFGRSSEGSGTHRFKKQWGAEAFPAVWQYHLRRGAIGDMRPENDKYGRAIQTWQRLPVWLTRLIGPSIVRGIP